jgi:hypothetical protein
VASRNGPVNEIGEYLMRAFAGRSGEAPPRHASMILLLVGRTLRCASAALSVR